jgi:hypothetical protein
MNGGISVVYSRYITSVLLLLSCACSNVGREFNKMQDPLPGTAIIYFYRPKAILHGKLTSYEVMDGNRKVATMYDGSYYPYVTKEGDKHFWAKTASKREIHLKVRNGKTYFIKTELDLFDGVFIANPKFVHVKSEKTALDEIKECSLSSN